MKNKTLFDRTVAILVKAYFSGKLKHGDCSACAVGNICAGNGIPIMEGNVINSSDYNNGVWVYAFSTNRNGERQVSPAYYNSNIKRVIDATGYAFNELADIEHSFETAQHGKSEDDRMFNGLMSVCDCLMLIHEATAEECAEAKLLFLTN